ncbi:hypothetical protein J4418_04975 [Candidatus Woesearchaeota archaeon]|nr:hypothetical protein [Candidatus Woesearchaeota archaeon]
MAEVIQYIGMDDLDEDQKRLLEKISEEYYDKIKRRLHNETSLSIHLKCYNKTGSRCKYSIHAKAVAPTRIFVSTKVAEWDFAKALHMALKDLESIIQKDLKQDGSKIRIARRKEA